MYKLLNIGGCSIIMIYDGGIKMENFAIVETIVKCVLTILCVVITGFVIPWLKGKMGTQNFTNAVAWVKKLVAAAEVLFPEVASGEKKKEYVMVGLTKLFPNLTGEQVEALIEDAVLTLNENVIKVHDDEKTFADVDAFFADMDDDEPADEEEE